MIYFRYPVNLTLLSFGSALLRTVRRSVSKEEDEAAEERLAATTVLINQTPQSIRMPADDQRRASERLYKTGEPLGAERAEGKNKNSHRTDTKNKGDEW